jgi:hypothetical protein
MIIKTKILYTIAGDMVDDGKEVATMSHNNDSKLITLDDSGIIIVPNVNFHIVYI